MSEPLDLRRESAHLVAALVRLLGPAHVALAEDVAQDALLRALHAWRLGMPERPRAWLLQVAKHRAIDELRRRKRFVDGATAEVEDALSPAADAGNQLAMMCAICDDALAPETHVTLILRWLCGLSSAEIARAFLVDVGTIDRRLHRGRARLAALPVLELPADLRGRQGSLERALYLLFNEGYHGSDPAGPLHPALCADAIRLLELLLEAPGITAPPVHALAALCCCNAARLATRLDANGVLVPLAEQDRTRWDRALIERGIRHLGASAEGEPTRWHLEAAIAFEHARAPSVEATDWAAIVAYYDALAARAPGPVVALNRGLAVGELHGVAAGRAALAPLAGDPQLAGYSFYWAARADLARRAEDLAEAVPCYQRAIELAASHAERACYERRLAGMPAAARRL